jgi:type I restriction-modification system DNA methylase subunit
LKSTLAPRNFEVKDEIKITLIGTKQEVLIPDLLILEVGKYEEHDDVLLIKPDGLKAIIETKNPKQYSTVGFKRLIDYCKALNHDLGFVTNFRDIIEYRLLPNTQPLIETRSFGISSGKQKLREIATYVLDEIQTKVPEVKEITDEALVKLLQYAVEDIQSHFGSDVSTLADTLGIFQISYDRDLFKPEERSKPQFADLIRRAAAFVILNQVIFYLALAHNTRLVGKIGKLSSLSELQGYFDHIADTVDYKAVFGAKVVPMLPPEALDTINSLTHNLEALNFYSIKREILGKIYHNLIPRRIRKRIAAYYTSNTACELLARLTIERGVDTILDPACGSGGFLVAAYNIKKEIAPQLHHKEIIGTIYGFDISLFASHLSVINLSLQNLREATDEVYITVDDAFNQHPSETVELLWSPPSTKLVAAKDGFKSKKVQLPPMDVVLMNPPFTRIERLEDTYQDYLIGKKGILKKFAKYVKGQSGLHCFFLLHATNFLKEKGRLGVVLPAATFSTEYGEKIQPFVLSNYRIMYMITYESLSTFSVDCDFKEILLVAVKSKHEARQDWKAKVLILKEELIPNEIEALANQLEVIKEDVKSKKYEVRFVPKSEFIDERNWMIFTRPYALKNFTEELWKTQRVIHQKDVVEFHEGYHLDAPNFFRLPNDYWEISHDGELYMTIRNKQTLIELNVPKKYLIPTLDVPDMHRSIFTEMNHYVVSIPESEPEEVLPQDVKDYIGWGAEFKKDEDSKSPPELYKILNYVESGRRWYTYGNHILIREDPSTGEKVRIGSHLALVEKFRTRKRECIAIFSEKLLTGSNSYFFGVFRQKKGIGRTEGEIRELQQKRIQGEKLLAAWFSSSIFLSLYLYYRREISLDYGRIKIGDMEGFPCINVSKLSEDEKNRILMEFQKLNGTKLPTLYEQLKNQTLGELDLAIMKALRIEQAEKVLLQLYADLILELDRTEGTRENPEL